MPKSKENGQDGVKTTINCANKATVDEKAGEARLCRMLRFFRSIDVAQNSNQLLVARMVKATSKLSY